MAARSFKTGSTVIKINQKISGSTRFFFEMHRTYLLKLLEFIFLFICLPALYRLGCIPIPMLPFLFAIFAVCVLIHVFRGENAPGDFWGFYPVPRDIWVRLAIFAVSFILLAAATYCFKSDSFLYFPRNKPLIWGLVLLLYPVLSVYQQEFIYRTFLLKRYGQLFGDGCGFVLASAFSFSFMHIVFGNWVAPILTLAGGLLFAANFAKNKSLFWVCFEHYLYGAAVFTVGLGRYFLGATMNSLG